MSEKFKFKKKFGQNFLRDDSVPKRILSSSSVGENNLIIEVGPGKGILTKELLDTNNNVISYEIDKELQEYLLNKFRNYGNFTLIMDDFLNRNLLEDINKFQYDKLFFIANLPYYITTPIITKVINSKINVDKMVIMVQKEVGERFLAKPKTKEYNSLTVYLNYYFNISKLFNVSRNEFIPSPNVDSVIVSLEKKEKDFLKNDELFFNLVRDSFKYKRKTLKNNLTNYKLEKVEEILNKYGYSLSVRAEELELKVFIDIANNL